MHRSCPPSPRLSVRSNDESSIEDYDDALFDIDDGEMEYSHERAVHNFESIMNSMNNEQSRPSSVTTADWEEPESWITSAQNSESCPVSTPGSSSGASPLTGTSSQGVSPGIQNTYEQAFPFSIPEGGDQSLSSISDVLQVEKDFMEYVMSFPLSVSNVPPQLLPASPVANTKKPAADSNPKVGLDHLDNLCKLMEQLSDLKEANIKLKRRVQYLEDIKTLHEIHKEMVGERKLYSSGLSEDEVQQLKQKIDEASVREPSEESQLNNMDLETASTERMHVLYRSKTANQIPSNDYKSGHKSRSTVINKERRERSKSVGHPGHSKAPKKRPSRWSKVKEVLGIEKTEEFSTGGEGEKSDERDRPERTKTSKESLNRKGSDKSKSSNTSRGHSTVLSSRSFSEVERQSNASLITSKKSGTLDSKTAQSMMERLEKEDMGTKKSPKSPWGKMKTMIQIRRDNRQQKSESSSSSPRDAKSTNKQPAVQASDRRIQRTNHKSSFQDVANGSQAIEYDSNLQSGQYKNRSPRHHRLEEGEFDQNRQPQKSPQKLGHRKNSIPLQNFEDDKKDENHKNKTEDRDNYREESNVNKENGKRKKSKPRPIPLDYVKDDQALPYEEEEEMGMSPLTQKKCMWTKMKGVLKGKRDEDGPLSLSVPSSPSSAAECLSFDFDLEKSKEENINSIYETPRGSECVPCSSGVISGSSPSITVTELLRELQQNLSDDFNKKLEEWQRCRAEGIHKVPSPQVERKDSFGRMRKISKPEKKISAAEKFGKSNYHIQKKDLSWLVKEQQKVDREIIRLSKEKQKFEKRAFRLKQLRETMTDGDGQKKEVLVKTSAGEFRFEGISDDFTKKLYEWETKKGVNPELSTIALLDESLKVPSEISKAAPCSTSVGSNSARPSPEPAKSCYQVSRASSEPDLSCTLKESNSNNQTMRSKSGDTLLSGEAEIVQTLDDNPSTPQQCSRDTILHGDDNYYSLLEENMYLLDQLKEKEEICSHLQNELDRLDDKTEKTNRVHQEEMEKYRQKLWEIHMSRPRDLQGSLRLISELKSRIEELQKCSDKLKADRERLEESFRYHSNQQARLADDLIRRVRELQETGIPWGISRGGCRRKWRKLIKCDQTSISRIHDLSTRLLQQARDVEQTLMERTRQVCHLRWELLHRDMSAVLLQAALHRVTSQGEPVTILPTWDKRRNRFKNIKAWSVDTTTRRPSEDLVTDDWLQERLHQLSMTPYNDWENIDFSPNDLMATAHELKKETLRLAVSRPAGTHTEPPHLMQHVDVVSALRLLVQQNNRVSDSEEKKSATCSAESEIADSDRYYDTGSAVNSRSSSFSSGPGGLRGSHSDTRLYERTRALRRNSSSSMSCVEASDSSSLHDSDRAHLLIKKFPWRTHWRSLDNVSSSCSSRSSVLEEDMNRLQWKTSKSAYRDVLSSDETSHNQLQVKYGSFKEVDEETEELKTDPSDWGSHCLITPRPIHLARISDTESEKNRHSPPSQSKRLRDVEYEIPLSRTSKFIPSSASSSTINSYKTTHQCPYDPNSSFPIACQFLTVKSPNCSEYESYSEQNVSYKSAIEGSIESLDKYETAIRDEELTVSDEKNSRDHFSNTKCYDMETFSEFEEDLRQRTIKYAPSSSNVNSHSQNISISNYIDHNKQSAHIVNNTVNEQINVSTSGSPNIMKFKYKGTKGFGRSPRIEYSKIEESSSQPFVHSQISGNNCENIDDSSKQVS